MLLAHLLKRYPRHEFSKRHNPDDFKDLSFHTGDATRQGIEVLAVPTARLQRKGKTGTRVVGYLQR